MLGTAPGTMDKSPVVARGSWPYCLHPKANKCEHSFLLT